MKYISKIFWVVILIIVVLPVEVVAKDKTETVGSIEKVLYSNASVDDVCNEFKENGYRAANKYKGCHIALAGDVKSVDSSGKTILLETPKASGISFECKCSSKIIKEKVGGISAKEKVIVFGKVKKADEKTFELEIENIYTVDKPSSYYSGGMSFSDGSIYIKSDIVTKKINANTSISLLKKWEDISGEDEWKKKMKDSFGLIPGTIFDLGDDEMLGVYSFSWDEIRKLAEKERNNGKEWKVFVQEKVERVFLLDKLSSDKNYDYDVGFAKSVKSIKVESNKFDYFYGIKDDKKKSAEVFFIKSDDKLIAIVYDYGEIPKNCGKVAFALSTLTIDNEEAEKVSDTR